MRRNKRLSIKKEKEDARSRASVSKEQDLAYFVHDRVELMRQVFSSLSAKEIKAMAPECMRKLSNDEIEELCLDELLGISSKRVCAIIDGAEPPSDTSSSESETSKSTEPEILETISLDSASDVSSSCASKKRHKKRRSKKKRSKHPASRPSPAPAPPRPAETVLELLELQARARALRAHLNHNAEVAAASTSDGEVVVKVEAAAVLEISSDEDTKPKVEQGVVDAVEKPPEPPPPAPVVEAAGHKKKKKKKQKSKEVEDPPPTTPQTTNVTTDNNDVVIIDEDDIVETSAEAVKQPTDIAKEKQTVAETESEPDYTITVPHNIPTVRKIKMSKNNVVISVPNVKGTDAKVASIVKNVKQLNSSVTKVKKTPKLYSKVVKPADQLANIDNTSKCSTDSVDGKAVKTDSGFATDNAYKSTKKTKNKDKNRKETSVKTSRQDRSGDQEDQYEITLQLSDSEKMDLLEDLDQKKLDKVTSSSEDSSPDSDTSNEEASSSESDTIKEELSNIEKAVVNAEPVPIKTPRNVVILNVEVIKPCDPEKEHRLLTNSTDEDIRSKTVAETSIVEVPNENTINKSRIESQITPELLEAYSDKVNENNINISSDQTIEVTSVDDIPVVHEEFGPICFEDTVASSKKNNSSSQEEIIPINGDSAKFQDTETDNNDKVIESHNTYNDNTLSAEDARISQDDNNIEKVAEPEKLCEQHTKAVECGNNGSNMEVKEKSPTEEGELPDKSDSEVEAFEVPTEIVCISDEDEAPVKKVKQKKIKKNKKEKKAKKEKKGNFPEVADQNFYTQKGDAPETNKTPLADILDTKSPTTSQVLQENTVLNPKSPVNINAEDDDVYEILELSDDSSCYEVDGISVLSKEPTSEEIEALSAKIDQIERVDIVTGERVEEDKMPPSDNIKNTESLENISWKDRYLGSKKVKQVLTTANILNAMRKKNKELKKKLIESKKIEEEAAEEKQETPVEEPVQLNVEEGSIEHFNLLEGSTKYVDPVKEPVIEHVTENETDNQNTTVEDKPQEVLTKEMKKDAKQLLKMYKRLLKYNDMHKEKDTNKKKKTKKQKKKKEGDPRPSVASSENEQVVEK